MVVFLLFTESNRLNHSNLTLHRKSAGFTFTDDPFDIKIKRYGTSEYLVSWTIAEKPGNEARAERYVVTWYDAVDGKELGSVSTAADKQQVGESLQNKIIFNNSHTFK